MKTIIDPRMLKNMLASEHFPRAASWDAWMLKRQNEGKLVVHKTNRHDFLWGRVLLLCVAFEAYFGYDPRNKVHTYEYLCEEVCHHLQRLAMAVVVKQDEEKISQLPSDQPYSQSHLKKVQFSFAYDVAVQFFGNDLTGSRGYTLFFSRAEARFEKLKNIHNAPKRVR